MAKIKYEYENLTLLHDVSMKEFSKKEPLDAVVKMLTPSKNDIVLDVGSGAGNTAFVLADRVKKVYALDSSRLVVEKVLKKNIKKNDFKNIEIVICEVEKTNFPDSYFDIITFRCGLHYLKNPNSALKEIYRILKPKGKFNLMEYLFSNFAKHEWVPIAKVREPNTHTYYTYEEIINLLVQNGFYVKKEERFLFWRSLNEWASTSPEVIRERLKEVVKEMNGEVHNELHFDMINKDNVFYYYNACDFLILKNKV